MKTSENVNELMKELIPALSEIKSVKKDAQNAFLKNKYATLDAIIETSKPILAKHNVSFLQTVSDCGIETFLFHTSGQWISSDCLKIEAEVTKGLSLAQATGVTITYAKRYQLGSLLGISTDDDTDGQFGNHKEEQPQKYSDRKPAPVQIAEPKPTAPKPQPMQKQIISKERFQVAINKIMSGDKKSYDSIKQYFELNEDQIIAVEDAWDFFSASIQH